VTSDFSTDGLLRSALRKLGAKPLTEDEDELEVDDKLGLTGNEEEPSSPFHVQQLRADDARMIRDESDDFDDKLELPNPKPASMSEVRAVLLHLPLVRRRAQAARADSFNEMASLAMDRLFLELFHAATSRVRGRHDRGRRRSSPWCDSCSRGCWRSRRHDLLREMRKVFA
jgi:hypothetical protein